MPDDDLDVTVDDTPDNEDNLDVTGEDGTIPPDEKKSPGINLADLEARLSANYERRLQNIAGNLQQKMTQEIAKLTSRFQPTTTESPLSAEEQSLFDRALRASDVRKETEETAQRIAMEAAQAAFLQEYRRRWNAKIDETKSAIGSAYTETVHQRVVRLLDVGLEDEAQKVLEEVSQAVKAKEAARAAARRKAGTGGGTTRGKAQPEYKFGSKATDRHQRAQDMARQRGRQ